MLKYFPTSEKGRIKLYEVEVRLANHMDSSYATPVYPEQKLYKIEKPVFPQFISGIGDNVVQDWALYDSIEEFLSDRFEKVKSFVFTKTHVVLSYEDFCEKMFKEADPVIKLR